MKRLIYRTALTVALVLASACALAQEPIVIKFRHVGYDGYAITVNKKFWDGLPADIRSTLDKAMQEATTYENELSLKENDEGVAKIRATGRVQVYDITPAEQTALRNALLPVHTTMESRIGKQWIDAVYKEAAAMGVHY
jgi:C4-dicarboxylate-binding protein DctP